MKRFTETLKWSDPWFRKLSPQAKLFWQWILDNCDHAGVIEPDFELASFQIGYAMGMDTLLEIGDRIEKLDSKKFIIIKFIKFQYGELSEHCKGHNPVFASLQKHGIPISKGMDRVIIPPLGPPKGGPKTGQDKDRTRQVGWTPALEDAEKWLADWKRNGADYKGEELKSAFLALSASGWMWGKNPVTDFRAALERQIQTDRQRNNHGNNSKSNSQRVDRSIGTLNEGVASQYEGLGRVAKVQHPKPS